MPFSVKPSVALGLKFWSIISIRSGQSTILFLALVTLNELNVVTLIAWFCSLSPSFKCDLFERKYFSVLQHKGNFQSMSLLDHIYHSKKKAFFNVQFIYPLKSLKFNSLLDLCSLKSLAQMFFLQRQEVQYIKCKWQLYLPSSKSLRKTRGFRLPCGMTSFKHCDTGSSNTQCSDVINECLR